MFCATQRTGSTLIVDDFRNVVGSSSGANELLYETIIRGNTELPWSQVWDKVKARNLVHGYFIDKVMFHYTPMLSAFMERNSIEGVNRCLKFNPPLFDKFYNFFAQAIWVYVDRRDVFAQAVSMYLAEATQLWAKPVGRSRAAAAAPAIGYDYSKLQQYLKGFLTEREQWQIFFRHYNIHPIRISYEDAATGYPQYLAELLEKTDLKMVETPRPRRLAKVGGELNERFTEFLRNDVIAELYARSHAGA